MNFLAASLIICYVIIGTPIRANIIDNIIMQNWKDKEVSKQSDPFFNPFGLTFPLFDMADDPMMGFLKSEGNKEGRQKELRRAKPPKPWFSFSQYLNIPEMSRKTKAESRKQESGLVGGNSAETAIPNDKITQTGDLSQTNSPPDANGLVRKTRDTEDMKHEAAILDDKQLEFDTRGFENHTTSKGKTLSKLTFPKGLSDILIIFQKVAPKPKSHQLLTSPSNHDCDEFCRNGMCGMRGPWNRGKEIEHETMGPEDTSDSDEIKTEIPRVKRGSLLGQYDRICILIIPIALGIGTLLFIIELRRIFKKMKKQSVLSTYDHQEC